MTSMATLAADYGQPQARYAIPLDRGRLFKWIPNDATAEASPRVLGHVGGYAGRWHEVRCPDKGANLTDAAVTLTVAGDDWRVLPAATLTANRIATLSTTGAVLGDVIEVTRLDATAFTYTIANGGAGGGNLFVLPISQRWWCRSFYDGTNWIARAAGQLP